MTESTVGRPERDRRCVSVGEAIDLRCPVLFDLMPIGIAVLDADDTVLDANQELPRLLGIARGELIGRPCFLTADPVVREALAGRDDRATSFAGVVASHNDGHDLWVSLKILPLSGGVNERSTRLLIVDEVSDIRSKEQQVARLTRFDQLTGLPNRLGFEIELKDACAAAGMRSERVAVAVVNLRQFRGVNEAYGRAVGDALLLAVARRLTQRFRDQDLVARPGRDVFLVLTRKAETLDAIAGVAARLLHCFDSAFHIDGRRIYIHASGGVAVYPSDGSSDALIEHAYEALSRAKMVGGSHVELFDATDSNRASELLALETDLQRAIEHDGELQIVFQPQIDLQTGHAAGVEALARWQHPRRGNVPPSRFIAVAESTGLIIELGARLLDLVCTDVAGWRSAYKVAPRVAVNISATQFRHKTLRRMLERVLEAHELPPTQFELEVTETAATEDIDATQRIVAQLKRRGFSAAIDDFGAGYSSLTYLQRLNADCLKIDRSFIMRTEHNEPSQHIVRSVIDLGRGLGLRTIAEGIETKRQLEFLRDAGCHAGQGNILAAPMGPDACGSFLADRAPPSARVGGA